MRQKRKIGTVALRTSQCGRKRLLTEKDLVRIRASIQERPDVTIEELQEKLEFKANYSTFERAVNRMVIHTKRSPFTPPCVSVPDVWEKRAQWKESIRPEQLEHLVFLDESGVNTNLTRLYGRNLSSKRVIDHTPLNTPKSTTVLSSIRLTGEKAFTAYTGGTTGERFITYLRDILISTLRPGDIAVMDNMRSHHVEAAGELLRQNGVIPLYLPPYSPDLNPIEMMWSKESHPPKMEDPQS